MTPKSGDILAGKYRVEKLLGEGGFGVVIAATHLELRQRVALKFLLPHALRERQIVERFLREARAMAGIRSQHVARVIDVGTLPGGAPYIVMEYLEGQDLAAVLAQQGPLPLGDVAAAILEACEAIAEAHALGIVHRDLKPANLFRARGPGGVGIIKVLDFGISKISGSGEDLSLTRSYSVLGSPIYASPEQLRSTKHVDHRSDIWSLGATMYHLATGTVPFAGETLAELAIRVTVDPTPAMPTAPRIPTDFEAIVRKCLEKDPASRYQSVVELAAALANRGEWADSTVSRRIAKSLGLPGRRMTRPPSVPSVTTTMRSSIGEVSTVAQAGPLSGAKKLGISIAAGLLMGAGLGGLVLVTQKHRPAPAHAAAAPPAAVTPPDAGPKAEPLPPPPRTYADVLAEAKKTSDCETAVSSFEAALELRPDGPEALCGLARCDLAAGANDKASSRFEAALRASPGMPEALIGLAETHRRSRHRAEALSYYRQYLAVAPAGPDAAQARRQVAELGGEARPPARRASPQRVPDDPSPPAREKTDEELFRR